MSIVFDLNSIEGDDPQRSIISTGNSDIDDKLGGGIPIGSLTLVEGHSGSGKSVLTQQFTWGSLWSERRVVLYTTERTVSSQVMQMDSLGLGVLDFLLLGRLKVFPIQQVSEVEPTRVLKTLADHIGRRESHDLAIVDSLTPMITPSSVLDIIAFFEQCRRLCAQGKTIVVTLHSYSLDDGARERIRSMCDANLNLRVENVKDQLVNVLEVAKVSGATMSTGNVVTFAIEPMMGLRIIPISHVKV